MQSSNLSLQIVKNQIQIVGQINGEVDFSKMAGFSIKFIRINYVS